MKKKEIKVVDLFCGIGGLSNGFYQEGFNVIAGYDSPVLNSTVRPVFITYTNDSLR